MANTNRLSIEDALHISSQDDVPPSYTEACSPTPSPKPLPPKPLPSRPRRFPLAFNIYCKTMSAHLSLGEHQDQPLYTVTRHTGWSGSPPIELRAGPDKESPILATADYHGLGRTMKLVLPPLAGQGPGLTDERMESQRDGFGVRHVFTLEVGPPGGGRRETFEWRHSSGEAIAAVGADSRGWKLVRVETGPPPGIDEAGGSRFVPGGFVTSDGREVVAGWSFLSLGGGNKVAKFMFLGTGASGLLGDRWEIMAVLTALGIYNWEDD